MITEQDLQEAIHKCQGVRNPDAKTCMMLASFYIIRNELYPKEENKVIEQYSYAAPPEQIEKTIDYQSDTDFGIAVYGKEVNDILAIMDETMEAIQVLNPPLYKSIMRKIEY